MERETLKTVIEELRVDPDEGVGVIKVGDPLLILFEERKVEEMSIAPFDGVEFDLQTCEKVCIKKSTLRVLSAGRKLRSR